MTQAYKVVIERDRQGGYTATFPELMDRQAQAGSLKMLMQRIQEAVALSPETGVPPVARKQPMLYKEAES